MNLRRGLSLSNIGIDPCYRPCTKGVGKVDLHRSIEFIHSQKIYYGLPVMVTGYWGLEEVQTLTRAGVLSAHSGDYEVDELVDYYSSQDTYRTMYMLGTEPESVVKFSEVRGKVRDRTKMKYLVVDLFDLDDHDGFEFIHLMRKAEPDMVIIARSSFSAHESHLYYKAGADLVETGVGCFLADSMQEMAGVHMSAVDLIRDHREIPMVAHVGCQTPGDVVKCLALGADFVGIGSDLKNYTLEEILGGIRLACAVGGHDNLDNFVLYSRPYERP